MAPPRKASGQKAKSVTRTPPETPRDARQSRRRSASPQDQPTPVRTRDEPPARSTRSWITAPAFPSTRPLASQRNPVDCPYLRCSASTLHQHLPHLQYYRPRPGRAVHHHGYGTSNRDTISRPRRVVTLRTPRRDHGVTLQQPNLAENNDAARPKSLAQGLDPPTNPTQGSANASPEAPATPAVHNAVPTIHQAPMTPQPSSPLTAPPTHGPSPLPLLEAQSAQTPPSSAAPNAKPDEYDDGDGPQTAPAPSHNYTYEELIRPLAHPTLPPAPGMAAITAILQDLRSWATATTTTTAPQPTPTRTGCYYTYYLYQGRKSRSRSLGWRAWKKGV